ncbi:unnamed protein product [Lupinus luteus]|uniref:Ribulose bisphosphate carboxylase small subunit domain-containing protein n=1 Tax=Lupinus luteus TaxID=3873 RepID=A0AAV1Y8M7_LUPLU
MSAVTVAAPVAAAGFVGLNSNRSNLYPGIRSIQWNKKIASNGSKTHCSMKRLNPINKKKFKTLSYLPPLSDDSSAKQIDNMLQKGWIPCIEFDEVSLRY